MDRVIHVGKKFTLGFCACGCGEEIPIRSKQRLLARYKHGHYRPLGEINFMWKGGIRKHEGYIQRLKPDHPFSTKQGYVLEHRLVWEEHNNAMLLSWGIVHHKNENKTDNRPQNLQGMMLYQHIRLHNPKDMSEKQCTLCGSKESHYKNPVNKWHLIDHDKSKRICAGCFEKIRYQKRKRLRRR